MTLDLDQSTYPTSNEVKSRKTRLRKTAILLAITTLAVLGGALLSCQFSFLGNDEESSEQTFGDAEHEALTEVIADADALRSIEEAVTEILNQQNQANEEEDEKDEADPLTLADFSDADWDSVPTDAQLSSFSLFGDDAPEISDESLAAIQDAIAAAEQLGSVSMVFLDASTGLGIAYNSGYAIYGASTFKGPYAVYICQSLIENGKASLDTAVSVTSTNTGSLSVDSGSSWATGGSNTYPTSELIAASIINSDNNAYGMLRNQFDLEGYDEWIASLGVEDAPRNSLSWYPTYCSLSSAKLWANTLSYLESETDTAAWLSDLFEQTSTSFIRDGISNAEDGDTAVVRDKAGWISSDNPTYNAVNDAGIVEVDGRTYLMCIFTSQPDSTTARNNVGALAAALFNAREELAQNLTEEESGITDTSD